MQTDGAFKILLLHVFNRADLNDSGVVEKNIDLAIACQNLGDGSLNLRTFKQIALDREDFATAHNQLRFGALELIRVPRQKCHFPAFPANEKRLRHAREASHAPRTVIAIAVPRLINSNSHLPSSPDDKLLLLRSDGSPTRHQD